MLIVTMGSSSCKESSNKAEIKSLYDSSAVRSGYYTDTAYKYEYRTGSSGNYEYNYDIVGQDEDGNDIEGNINIQGKYGSGTVTDIDGNERNVEVEWVGYGELEGTDDGGNTYMLEAD